MDSELQKLFQEYIEINNEEKEGDLERAAEDIREYQAKLLKEEGHVGIGEVTEDGRS